MSSLWRDLQTWRFWRVFFVHVFAAVGLLAVLLEVVGLVAELPIPGWALITLITVISLAYGAFKAWPRPIEQDYNSPNTRITVAKGDLFAQDCHIVVGTCDTFDTAIPIIAGTSVQGQALTRVYGGDLKRLDGDISEAIRDLPVVDTIEKAGKTARYGVGAIAVLQGRPPHRLYLVAYSEMNEHNEAQSTPDGIWKSLASLWDEVSRTANGGTIAVPVIGGGQSRLSQVMPAQDSIRFIILSFMFASRTRRICDELRIVVREQDYDRLDRMELQAFLSSLRPS